MVREEIDKGLVRYGRTGLVDIHSYLEDMRYQQRSKHTFEEPFDLRQLCSVI